MDTFSINSLDNNFSSQLGLINQQNFNTTSFEQELKNAITNNDDESLKEACIEFESYFLKMMLSTMRNTITFDEEGFFAKSDGEKIFQDLLDEEICNSISKGNNSIGLANMLYKQLSKTNHSFDFEV